MTCDWVFVFVFAAPAREAAANRREQCRHDHGSGQNCKYRISHHGSRFLLGFTTECPSSGYPQSFSRLFV